MSRQDVLSTFMHSFFALGLVSVQFALIGYSLASERLITASSAGSAILGSTASTNSTYGASPHVVPATWRSRVSVHVRGDHAGADLRRVRRAHKFSAFALFTAGVDDVGLRSDRALDLERRRLGSRKLGRESTTRAAQSCTLSSASRR